MAVSCLTIRKRQLAFYWIDKRKNLAFSAPYLKVILHARQIRTRNIKALLSHKMPRPARCLSKSIVDGIFINLYMDFHAFHDHLNLDNDSFVQSFTALCRCLAMLSLILAYRLRKPFCQSLTSIFRPSKHLFVYSTLFLNFVLGTTAESEKPRYICKVSG